MKLGQEIFEFRVLYFMLALAERQRPFQMRQIRNPFNRAVSAVENFRDQVVANVREIGNNLTHRTQRVQAPPTDYAHSAHDAEQLERARATIATATSQPSLRGVSRATDESIPSQHSAKKAIIHCVVEATKNSAPAVVVGAGARVILGTTLGVQALGVAAGASAISRGVREATFTVRKGAFGETTKLITKHEEASILQNFDGSERVAHTGVRAKQDQFARTRVGKVANALLHGGEKKIAEFAYGKGRHARALVNAQYQDIHSLSDKELIALREHAVMARITHGTEADVYEMRQLAKSMYRAVNAELANRGTSRQEAHERQLKLYRKDVRVGAALNIVGQACLAALKAVPKTFATFFITDAFLKAIHVDTSARHNPLEGFENTRLGHTIENLIAPKAVVSAEELNANVPNITQAAVSEVKNATATAHGESVHSWTQGLVGARSAEGAPSVTVSHTIINGREATAYSQVLSTVSPRPMHAPEAMPNPPSYVRTVPELDDRDSSRAVLRVALENQKHTIPTQTVVPVISQEHIDGKVSLTRDIAEKRLFPEMQNMVDPTEWYRQTDTAVEMMKRVIMPNADKMSAQDIMRLQEYLKANPHASFRQMWLENRNVFSDDLDRLTRGADYTVVLDKVVTQQEAQKVVFAEVKNAKVELADHVGRGKTPGHAKEIVRSVVNSNHKQADGPGVVLIPTQSTGTDTSHYQIVRPPQGAGATSVIRTSQGTYQQVAPPGGRSVASNTVNGFQQVERPGAIPSHNGIADPQVVRPPQNGVVPPPRPLGSPDTIRTVPSTVNGYQQVAPPRGGDVIHHSPQDSYQQVGQPTSKRPSVVVRPANESYQIVNPPKPDEQVSFQHVSVPRVTMPYEVPSDTHSASVMGPFDLTGGQNHVAYLESTSPYFPTSSSMPISILNDRAPAIGGGAYEYNALGGLNIWSHTSSFKVGGRQWLEDARVFMQGGNGQPRLGPVQELYRAQQLMQSSPHLFINVDNQHQSGFSLSGVHHLTLNNDGSLNLSSTDGVIGGGPETVSFIGCSYGHVQAIQMIIDHANEAPQSLNQWFAILNDPNATGPDVENAVDQIVKLWFRGTAYYSEFYKLYGYLQEEIPSFGTPEYTNFLNKLANNGYMSSGRLEFEFTAGGQ